MKSQSLWTHMLTFIYLLWWVRVKRTKLPPSKTAYLIQMCISSITANRDIKRVIKTILGATVFILYVFYFHIYTHCDRKTIQSWIFSGDIRFRFFFIYFYKTYTLGMRLEYMHGKLLWTIFKINSHFSPKSLICFQKL